MVLKINMSIKINKDIVVRMIEDNCYLVDAGNHILHRMNETGTLMFTQMKKNSSLRDIVKAVCENYDVGEGEAEKDLNEFINILKEKNILMQDE